MVLHLVPRIVGLCVLAAGIAAGGYLAGRGVLQSRLQDRSVTVKGVAELELKADLAVLPLRFTATAGDIRDGQRQIEESTGQVVAFLKGRGFAEGEISVDRIDAVDRAAQIFDGGREDSAMRYVLNRTVTVRSTDVDRITALDRASGELLREGIVLGGHAAPTYVVTAAKLNAVKPELIRRATAAARVAADEFAELSGSAIGRIKRANQGVIVILARDPGEDGSTYEPRSVDKRIRAVATVDYYLER